MIIDPAEAVIAFLAADAGVQALVGARVASKHRYGEQTGGWKVSETGLSVRLDGGTPDIDVPVQEIRLETMAFAVSQAGAMRVWRELVRVARRTNRNVVNTSAGKGLIYRLNQASGPSLLFDQDLRMDVALCFFEALVSELEVAA